MQLKDFATIIRFDLKLLDLQPHFPHPLITSCFMPIGKKYLKIAPFHPTGSEKCDYQSNAIYIYIYIYIFIYNSMFWCLYRFTSGL